MWLSQATGWSLLFHLLAKHRRSRWIAKFDLRRALCKQLRGLLK
jgi:hypothetical protein